MAWLKEGQALVLNLKRANLATCNLQYPCKLIYLIQNDWIMQQKGRVVCDIE